METIIPEDSTIKFLKKMEMKDIFSLDEEKKLNEEEDFDLINNEYNSENSIKLEKNLKENIKVSSESSINCIYSINNLLLIACNDEVKIYDIKNNFEIYGSIKLSEPDKGILCMACSEIDNILYCFIGGEFSSIHVVDILSFDEITGYQLIGHKKKNISNRSPSKH